MKPKEWEKLQVLRPHLETHLSPNLGHIYNRSFIVWVFNTCTWSHTSSWSCLSSDKNMSKKDLIYESDTQWGGGGC
jgi:hypothetical protein